MPIDGLYIAASVIYIDEKAKYYTFLHSAIYGGGFNTKLVTIDI